VELVIDLRQTLIITEATSRIRRATELLHSQTIKYYPIYSMKKRLDVCHSFTLREKVTAMDLCVTV
jgi:hypothetical protein